MKSLLRQSSMTLAVSLAVVLCGISVLAQESAPKSPKPAEVVIERHNVIVTEQGGPEHIPMQPMPPMSPMPPPPDMMGGNNYTFNFVSSEMSFDRKVVKGAPYSADVLTETVQTLGDGNRIVRKSSAKIYRDGEGRTRRDQTLNAIGPFATSGDTPQMSFINDPVSGVNFTLDQRSRTARKMTFAKNGITPPPPGHWEMNGGGAPGTPKAREEHPRVMIMKTGPGGEGGGITSEVRVGPGAKEMPKPVVESLGKQTVEGVEAEGTRTTFTIPAGEIGNERPIQIVNEKWYSPELQTVVMSKRNDPLAGETTYRLTNINRTEPDHSLFEVPADYKVREGGPVYEFHYKEEKKPGDVK